MTGNREIYSSGRLIKLCALVNAWYESVENPETLISSIKKLEEKQHIFTFFQRPPHIEPKFNYYKEPYSVAVIKLKSYDDWWNNSIGKYARQAVKRSQKYGVEVRAKIFDDEFIKGISRIYNETPLRAGKKFPHYNDSLEKVKKENGTFIDRSLFLGAYYETELVGFAKIVFEEEFADILQLLSKISHRYKCVTNALLAKIVEVCSEREVGYIAYGNFDSSGLGDFKRHNGFTRMDLPRYYIPLNLVGKVALRLKLHRSFSDAIPDEVKPFLRGFRKWWFERRVRDRADHQKSVQGRSQ